TESAGDDQPKDGKANNLMQCHMTGFQEPPRRSPARCLALALGLCFLGNFAHRFLESTTQGARPIGVAANRCIPYAASYGTVRLTWLIRLIAEFGGASY